MKIKLVIALSIFLATCSSQSYFKLMESTSQKWSAGIKGSGTGITYKFTIKLTSEDKLEFGRAWIGNRYSQINVKRPTMEEVGKAYSKGDELVLECRFVDGKSIEQIPPPIQYEGEALIEYFINDDKKYIVVDKIEKLEKSISY